MKNNDTLKKHHFWILFGLVPLFVLIAVLMISSSVGGKIKAKNDEIETAKKDLAGKTSAKSKGDLAVMDKSIETVDGKKGGLWKQNWDKQKDLFTWPKSEFFTGFVTKEKVDGKDVEKPVRLEDLTFGQPIPNNADQYEEFKKPEFYLAEFSTVGITKIDPGRKGMVDRIAPTQFNGGWRRHLRHVTDWGQKAIISEQIWLVLEDMWVQRSLLDAVRSVNDQMGRFERIKYADAGGKMIDDPESEKGPHDPLRRKFRSRTWEVSIEVAKKGNKQYLKGTLENITERLQVLGIGKTMTLKVWLEANRDQDGNIKIAPDGQPDVEGIEPVEFKIGSEFLPGKGGMKKIKDAKGNDIEVPSNIVTMQPDESNEKEFDKYANLIPAGKTVSEIVRVEQKFDTQTVPIRRIEAMQLGKTDSRYAALGVLKTPNKEIFKTLAAAGTASSTTSSPTGAGPEGTSGAGPRARRPGAACFGGGDERSGSGGFGGGGGRRRAAHDRHRRQLRSLRGRDRASSPHAHRHRGDRRSGAYSGRADRLRELAPALPGHAGHVDALPRRPRQRRAGRRQSRRFRLVSDLPAGSDRRRLRDGQRSRFVRVGGMRLPGRPAQLPRGGSAHRLPAAAPRGHRCGRPSGHPSPAARVHLQGRVTSRADDSGDLGPFGGGGSLTTVSEAQLTSGLVELSVYGIVSLYEKYDPAKDPTAAKDGDAKKDGEAKKDTEGKDQDAPKDKEEPKEKKDAKTDAAADPKKRVRRRLVKL